MHKISENLILINKTIIINNKKNNKQNLISKNKRKTKDII